MVILNLPVRDLLVSAAFYRSLGFAVDEEFCEAETVSVRVSDSVLVMLLSFERYAGFLGPDDDGTPTRRGDVHAQSLTSISTATALEVEEIYSRALAAGGSPRSFVEQGPVHGRSFADPDGHVWELIHMDLPDVEVGPGDLRATS
jgi:predicted lactoylglutathione lyase